MANGRGHLSYECANLRNENTANAVETNEEKHSLNQDDNDDDEDIVSVQYAYLDIVNPSKNDEHT